jgi:hypothetical protein
VKQATQNELIELIVMELNKVEGCENVSSVPIRAQSGVPNWEFAGSVLFDEEFHSPLAIPEARKIVERLQQEYELIADTVFRGHHTN